MLERERTLTHWLGELTASGYDIAGVNGHTMRSDPGDDWNSNHPMPSIVFHLQKAEKKTTRDFILKAYATNSRNWTVYGTAFSGKASLQRFGFIVTGTKETEIGDYDKLVAFLEESAVS